MFTHTYKPEDKKNHPLNQKIIFFITNPSEDKSKGSSLYFVNSHGTIRCRSDLTGDRPPITTINPFMVGYYRAKDKTKKIEIVEPEVGLFPFEAKATNLYFLNLHKERKAKYHHYGHIITEIVSLEQFNDQEFVPKTWVNRNEIGLLWPTAVDQIKKAVACAYLNERGHYIKKQIIIPVKTENTKKDGCIIS